MFLLVLNNLFVVFASSLWYDIIYLLIFLHIFSQLIWGFKNGMYEGIQKFCMLTEAAFIWSKIQ